MQVSSFESSGSFKTAFPSEDVRIPNPTGRITFLGGDLQHEMLSPPADTEEDFPAIPDILSGCAADAVSRKNL